jgi:cobalt/nickel transport system permease protein
VSGEGFLARNIAGFSRALESIILSENLCRFPGLVQALDPRIKIVTFVLFIVVVGLARSLWILGVIFFLILALSLLSRVPTGFFLKRILLFVPIFTILIAVPALFITPGNPLVYIAGKAVISEQGARTAGLLVLRVTDSLSLGVLLILTTSWTKLLAALRWLHMPAVIVDILGMTYRYIFLLLHTTNSMFLSRRSRTLGSFSAAENRRWLARALTATLTRSQHLSEEVYLAMLSRGYQGEIRMLNDFRTSCRDYLWTAFVLMFSAALLWGNSRW